MAHGYYIEEESKWTRSHLISKAEIVQSDRDYIALGHLGTSWLICITPTLACYAAGPAAFGTVTIVELVEGIGAQARTTQLWQQEP